MVLLTLDLFKQGKLSFAIVANARCVLSDDMGVKKVHFVGVAKKIVLCTLCLMPLSGAAASYSKLVVFGDSLSDMGNLAMIPAYQFLKKPPYRGGFTNGQMAVGHLAKFMGLPLTPSLHLVGAVKGDNFAVAVAVAVAVAGARVAAVGPMDLEAQITAYLSSPLNKTPSNTLYIVFLGGNDIRDMRDQNDQVAAAVLKNVGSQLSASLSRLIKSGANHFLVVNSPDLGLIPETRGNATLMKRGSQKSVAYNTVVQQIVTQINKTKGMKIVLFDLQSFMSGLWDYAASFQFSNRLQACYSSTVFGYYPGCSAAKIDSFSFFDEIHPTQRVHERLGRALFSVIPEAGALAN